MAKGPDAFRTISEAADELGVPQHVLRFWETKFSFIRPMKRAGGRRFYRRQDLEVLRGVRVLLHDAGYTIKGVQRLHKEQGVRRLVAAAGGDVEAVAVLEADLAPGATPHAGGGPGQGVLADGADGTDGHALDPDARTRLVQALQDVEDAKARLDALIAAHRT